MKTNTSLKPWSALEVFPEDNTFQILFWGDSSDYVSEIYAPEDGESMEDAALRICQKFGWDKQSPAK